MRKARSKKLVCSAYEKALAEQSAFAAGLRESRMFDGSYIYALQNSRYPLPDGLPMAPNIGTDPEPNFAHEWRVAKGCLQWRVRGTRKWNNAEGLHVGGEHDILRITRNRAALWDQLRIAPAHYQPRGK